MKRYGFIIRFVLYIIFPFILAFKTSFFQEATVYQNQFQWQNTDRRNVVEKAKTAGFPTQLQAGYNTRHIVDGSQFIESLRVTQSLPIHVLE